ncbi:MAG TPA: DUF1318 domain-containing protein [Steroidobacteraceae bacterium]|nr:DUF1318 domain-containing protein [Steroidobacteraceae bacterium]
MNKAIAVTGLTSLLALAVLNGCVTVNVYFPAAEAQQAADKIIDAVTGSTGGPAPQEPQSKSPPPASGSPPSANRSAAVTPGSMLLAATGHLLELLVPAAAAQERANLDISTPQIRAIIGSMRQRFQLLKPFLASGAVGFTADGAIAVRDPSAVPLGQRATLVRLVTQQSQDLSLLYAEVARANGHPEWASDIRNVFAQRWVARSRKKGWYYRDGSGSWKHN